MARLLDQTAALAAALDQHHRLPFRSRHGWLPVVRIPARTMLPRRALSCGHRAARHPYDVVFDRSLYTKRRPGSAIRTPVAEKKVPGGRTSRAACGERSRTRLDRARTLNGHCNGDGLEVRRGVPEPPFSAADVLEWYRLRWRVELVFKRFKSLAQLGHLPKYDDDSAKAWLYGKLFVALLVEKLLHHARAISPWGYDVPAPIPPAARGVTSSSC